MSTSKDKKLNDAAKQMEQEQNMTFTEFKEKMYGKLKENNAKTEELLKDAEHLQGAELKQRILQLKQHEESTKETARKLRVAISAIESLHDFDTALRKPETYPNTVGGDLKFVRDTLQKMGGPVDMETAAGALKDNVEAAQNAALEK